LPLWLRETAQPSRPLIDWNFCRSISKAQVLREVTYQAQILTF